RICSWAWAFKKWVRPQTTATGAAIRLPVRKGVLYRKVQSVTAAAASPVAASPSSTSADRSSTASGKASSAALGSSPPSAASSSGPLQPAARVSTSAQERSCLRIIESSVQVCAGPKQPACREQGGRFRGPDEGRGGSSSPAKRQLSPGRRRTGNLAACTSLHETRYSPIFRW